MSHEEKTKKPMLQRHKIMTVEEAREYLLKLQDGILNTTLLRLAQGVLFDIPEFWTCPAAKGRHQAYPGGLAVHTAQVISTALDMLHSIQNPDGRLRFEELIVAGLWHDIGKIEDYEIAGYSDPENRTYPKYEYTPHKDLVGHLSKSAMMFGAHLAQLTTDKRYLDEMPAGTLNFITHLILSHHGRKEWGSPVEPQCAEAWALHCADMMSSQFIED